MRAVQIASLDGPSAVVIADVPEPPPSHPMTPGRGVVIDVKAAAVSFPELLMSRGRYQDKHELPFVPGAEVSGIVRSAPPDADVRPGDRVAAYTRIGGLAEVATAADYMTFPLPERFDFAQGAALVLNYQTAYFALVTTGRLEAGERVLVHGAAGGVGTAALQLIRALAAEPIAVVSDDAKEAVAREAGAAHVLRSGDPWLDQARELTGAGVDMVLDLVGGDRFLDSLRSLRTGGRLIVAGFAAGTIPELRVNRLLLRNLAVIGASWGLHAYDSAGNTRAIGDELQRLADAGAIEPVVGARVRFEDAADAFALLDERKAMGKVVVELA